MIAAITCDILYSRKYSNDERLELNEIIKTKFDECCKLIPQAEADKLSFSIIQGDEFQFLLNKPEYAYQFVVYYRLILYLTKLQASFRTGIGLGDISVSNSDTYKMDGVAFHRSRDAMKKFNKKNKRNRITFLQDESENINKYLEIIAYYNDLIEQSWTPKQKEAIYLHKKYTSFNKAAQIAQVSRQALQQRINSSGWKHLEYGLIKYFELLSAR